MKRAKKKFIEVIGYLEEDEAKILQEFSENKTVLEIGSYYGRSTLCFAEVAKQVTTIDTYKGAHPNDQYQSAEFSTLDDFRENIAGYKNIESHIGTSDEILPKLNKKYDVIFIDGCHFYENTLSDIKNSLRLLSDDGILIVHDYYNHVYPGVPKAANEVFQDKDGEFDNKLVWFRKKNIR